MGNRYYGGRIAHEVKVDYLESRLDKSIREFKEEASRAEVRHAKSIVELREALWRDSEILRESLEKSLEKLETKHEADRKATEARLIADREESRAKLEAERIAAENRLANDRQEFEKRFAEERREWRSTKRWLYINFIAIMGLLITAVVAVFGFFAANGIL